ncbi:hypothetical protein [Marinobacter sp. HL-58]|uniref:hypothetical protein n=1 Tax=Marinobacter sp. HL-58 TaxID=1479237 RepID=UPI000488720C|nr:hypothetical protein [Marinobacter sp. HL-58]KPP96780.1 MAG: hypothetical protein HLUCCO03_02680 [Marinobacter sp. HL-58]
MKKLTLKLNDRTPETLSMKRLGQYITHLSDMLGEVEHVHFDSVSKGSAMLNVDIEDLHYQKVLTHVREVPNGMGAKKQLSAYRSLQQLMDEDGTGGVILNDTDTRILSFRKRPDDEKPLVVNKLGSVQGRLYRVGGKDDTIPVSLEGAKGETLRCEASIDIARELSSLLFKQVRVSGHGTWERSPEGSWRLKKLKIESYQELDTAKVGDVVGQLKSIGGLKWADMDDPHAVARDLRG